MHSLASCVVFIYSFLLGIVHLIELPTLNLDSVGQLGFIGDYAGLSPFKTKRQFETLFNESGILLKREDDTFEVLFSIQGNIETSCQNPFTNSILFGGQFDSTGDGQYFNGRTSQSINLATSATISSGNGALTGENASPSSLICSQAPWLLQDGVPGYWEAKFTSTITPSIFRLSNSDLEGRNTNEFNIMVLGSNEYFELSYNDPITNEPVTCTEQCYLSKDLAYQDFTVITPLPTKALRININSWDGEGGGLGGVEIFRSDVALQPQLNSNNSSGISCSDNTKSSTVTTTGGDWTEKFDYGNYQDYLFSTVSADDVLTKNPTVTYQPRLIYSGPITATTDRFKPTILLRPSPSTTVSTISADAIEFVRNTDGSILTSILDYYPQDNKWMPLSEQLPTRSVVKTIQPSRDRLYIGGQFKGVNSTFSNIVSYQYNQGFQPLAESGLNGNVTTSLLMDKTLYVGGNFNNTLNGSHRGLHNIAMYDTQSNAWSTLDEGLNDSVSKLFLTPDNTLHISGQFTSPTAHNNAQWNHTHFINPKLLEVGPISTILPLPMGMLYAGAIKAAQAYRANDASFIRKDQLDTLITTMDANATVTAGLFWKNTSDHDSLVTILGGRFHLDNVEYRVVMHRDGVWTGHFDHIEGEIHAMAVVKDHLCIGGQFKGMYQNTNVTSFAMFDLLKQRVMNINGIFDSNKNPGLVNVIRSNGKQIYVGGQFAYAGFLNCATLCTFSTLTRQWTQANQGIEGTIIDIALQNGEKISVVGDLNIKGTKTQMAHIESENTPWIPTSLDVSDSALTMVLKNENDEVLVAGRNATTVFLGSWNGERFEALNVRLGSASYIRQLLFIPIDAGSSVQGRYPSGTDTMLMAVGHLELPTMSASAALFDGSEWYPFLLSSSQTGEAGHINQMFTQSDCCTAEKIHHYLSVPAVILISIAISLGMIFCMASIGFLIMTLRKKRKEGVTVPVNASEPAYLKPRYTPMGFSAMLDSVVHIPAAVPSSKMHHQASSGFSTSIDQSSNDEYRLRNSSGLIAGASFSALVAMALRNSVSHQPASDEYPQIYYAKFPFEAKEFGELSFDTNTQIVVTDTSDHVWWMGYKDDGSGNPVSGLFPSNYVSSTKP
ncbi:hypothetical protein K501DRAFT_302145 [Backusella circina FSU 941]|nr:hypothetical protein K501DRAFT_302145 [Backusella circina FSU 941]